MYQSKFFSRLNDHPVWLGILIVTSAVILATFWYLWASPVEFPMDDSYIHLVYAENLVKHGGLFFNQPDDIGIGTTSLGWVLLLASGSKLGLSMHFLSKALGVFFLSIFGICLYTLLRSSWRPFPALVCTLFTVLSGHMLWFSLSGMETIMFLAIGTLSLLFYRLEKWGWLGFILGLLAITRIEGLVLLAAIFLVDFWHHRRITKGLLISILIATLICSSWIFYLYHRTGLLLPTSGAGKIFALRLATQIVVERNKFLALLGKYPSLLYPFIWVIYFLEFVLGGIALPPPRIPVGLLLGNPDYTYSIWAFILLIGIVFPLVWASVKKIGKPGLWAVWVNQDNRRPIIIFGLWVVIHNLAYLVVLPIPGTASRYGAINHVALWIVLVIGLFSLLNRTRLWAWFAGGLFVIAVVNGLYWKEVYRANLAHMINVRMRAGRYIAEGKNTGGLCAAFDIGALRFYSKNPIIDLGGLINPELIGIFQDGELDQYLKNNGVTCLAVPGRTGTSSDGWFDFIDILDLSSSPYFEIQQIVSFEIDRKTWLKGYLPTGNYQATVTLYRLIY